MSSTSVLVVVLVVDVAVLSLLLEDVLVCVDAELSELTVDMVLPLVLVWVVALVVLLKLDVDESDDSVDVLLTVV
eukprot:3277799-Amphidinium_carterae.1